MKSKHWIILICTLFLLYIFTGIVFGEQAKYLVASTAFIFYIIGYMVKENETEKESEDDDKK
jgi:L-asparagine transporter-like permease